MKKLVLFLIGLSVLSCSQRDMEVHDDNEGITTVELTFTPSSGSDDEIVYNWRDGSGELIQLKKNTEYQLTVAF